MTALLDLLALAAVVASVAFLLRPRRPDACRGCAPSKPGARTVIALAQLRASARRAAGRH